MVWLGNMLFFHLTQHQITLSLFTFSNFKLKIISYKTFVQGFYNISRLIAREDNVVEVEDVVDVEEVVEIQLGSRGPTSRYFLI